MKRSRKKSQPPKTGSLPHTRADLLARAKGFRIQGRHRMTKSELIRALGPYLKKKPRKPIPAKKSKPSTTPSGSSKRYDDLPWSYGKTELVLMPVDPFLLHAYWDFSAKDWEAVQVRRKPVVLRIYDVTMIEFDGTNAHQHSDIPVFLKAQNWYVPIWSAEKSLCADLGWLLPDGSFHPIIRSNTITTPRAGLSISEESRWVEVRPDGRKITGPDPLHGPNKQSRKALAFWKKLEQEAESLTKGKTNGLSSQRPPQAVQSKTRG